MGSSSSQPHRLMIEVSHHINSPLAAIRSALYLAATRTDDPEVLRYLQLADAEAASIINAISGLREIAERRQLHLNEIDAPPVMHFKRAA
jgi:signal transduction histidine kinase